MDGSPPTDYPDGPREPADTGRAPARFFGRRQRLQSPSEALQPEAAPPPPPGPPPSKRRPVLSAFSGFLSFLLIGSVVGALAMSYAERRLRDPGPLAADKVVVIAPHTDVPEIIAQLQEAGIIDSPFLVNAALVTEGKRSRVKAGEYLFRQNASLRDVIDTLVSGKEVLHALTIPEGLTSEQIVQRLRDEEVLAGDVKDIPPEGSLLPETYKFARGTPRTDILRKMQDDQKKALDQVWSHRAPDLTLRSPYEMLTLASIVEKETGRADERPRVAGVFLNRLSKRMRLQSDPTIVYGLVGGKGTLGRGILRSEIDQPTRYNTYQIDGLPPGPIANPGRAALEAVANPSRTRDLYFVADGTGGHAFAESIDQHTRNVARWRQLEKDKAASADVDHVAPQAIPVPDAAVTPPPTSVVPGRPQRSDAGTPSIYGSLSTTAAGSVSPSSLWPAVSAYSSPDASPPASAAAPAAVAVATAVSVAAAPPAKPTPGKPAPAPVPAKPVDPTKAGLSRFSFGDVESMGLSVKGLDKDAPMAASLDGPADDGDSMPLSPAMRAELNAKAAKYGLPEIADPVAVAAPNPAAVGIGRKGAVDASQGTPLDPLLNKSWDLNAAHTVSLK